MNALPWAAVALLLAGVPFKLSVQYWRFAGTQDLLALAAASVAAAAVFPVGLREGGAVMPGPSFPVAHALALMDFDTGVDLPRLITASKRLPTLIGHDTPSQITKAGQRLDLHPVPADFNAIRARALARNAEPVH